MSSHYNNIPKRLLTPIAEDLSTSPQKTSYCAGYELSAWRCNSLADHLMEWIVDYALSEDELSVHHGNLYIRLKEAAARIYTSAKYKQRGEVGEIALHAVCRDFFGTIPIAPRVFYLTASNDVVKSFDMVHVRYIEGKKPELWLGESKFYTDPKDAISAAIESISTHIDRGFLNNQKLLLGPQVSKSIPHYQEIKDLLSTQTSIDELFKNAVFPVFIACDSKTTKARKKHCADYINEIAGELDSLNSSLIASGLHKKIRLLLIYIPLAGKSKLAAAFDKRLKGVSQ